MIEFLTGAFSVLLIRGESSVKILATKTDVLPSVAERCRRVAQTTQGVVCEINNKIATLKLIKKNLDDGFISAAQADRPLKRVLLSYRDLRRQLDAIEENFVGHMARYNTADLFFTQLAAALWQETNLPDIPPIAVTNTSGYFCTLASLGIIFSPPSTEHNLLIFPDLYHEFGHILHEGMQIELFGVRFAVELQTHIAELKNQVRRTARPIEDRFIDDIEYRWVKRWAEEIACDTLAAYILGPAYGWCNLHLCLQNSNAYSPGGEHPADAARTRHILRVLRRRGFVAGANEIESLWNRYISFSQQTPTNYYQDYHPDNLFVAVMEDVEQAIKDNGFGVLGTSPTIDMLNHAWVLFNQNNADYYDWEKQAITKLKADFT